jgi:ribonuclease HI
MVFYVVHKGRKPGIYLTWDECKKNVEKYEGALFKKFTNKEEAQDFLKNGFGKNKPKSIIKKENIDKKNENNIKEYDNIDENKKIYIYTDGSCIKINNNQYKAGYGIYIPEKNIQVSKPLINQKITNNRAELTAIIESINYLDDNDLLNKKIIIFTDSQYSIYLFNGTAERYEKNNFKNNDIDVPNIDLIKVLLYIKRNFNIVLLKIRAHTDKKDEHSLGNSIADKLANDASQEEIKMNNKISIFNINEKKSDKNEYFDETYDSELENDELENNELENNNINNSSNLIQFKELNMNELFENNNTQKNNIEKQNIINNTLISLNYKKPYYKDTKLSKWFVKKNI